MGAALSGHTNIQMVPRVDERDIETEERRALISLLERNAEDRGEIKGLLTVATQTLSEVANNQRDTTSILKIVSSNQDRTVQALEDLADRKVTKLVIERFSEPSALKWVAVILITLIVGGLGVRFAGPGFSIESANFPPLPGPSIFQEDAP